MIFKDLSVLICILLGTTRVVSASGDDMAVMMVCPQSPNCVSSVDKENKHFAEPIVYTVNRKEAMQKLINIIVNSRGARMVKTDENYIHAEFRSRVFRFVDDVEFYFPAEASIIHVKSASRTGYYDFGVNRRRVENIRAAFSDAQGQP
jgi:uncharacterized protein (DUF1499 family)